MKHLKRAGGLLIALLIIGFVIPRVMPVPESLEKYGFYPKSNEEGARVWASQPLVYAETSDCRTCHQEKYDTWSQAAHNTVSCENCHGPGLQHIREGADLSVDASRELCGSCHGIAVARPSLFPQVDLGEHGGQQSCVTCHDPHTPQLEIAPAIPHSLQGRENCLLCHDEGGIRPFPADHSERGADTCLSCHQAGKGK